MSEKDNSRVAEEYLEAMNAHDYSRMRTCQAEGYQAYVPGMQEPLDTVTFQTFYEGSWTAFPDATYEETIRVTEGDCVMANLVMTATHTGPMTTNTGDTVPASGRKVTLPASGTLEFKDGKLVRETIYYDRMGLLAQVGVMPGA